MYTDALSVPEAIRKILANDYVYMQALTLGIANYTALAERIKPDIERLTGSKVNLNTIVVAIKRFADTLEKKKNMQHENSNTYLTTTTKAKMSLTGSIIDIDFQKENNDNDNDALATILDEFFEQDSRYNLFQTDSHFSLLTED